jgi:hypothetical protein
VTCHRACYPRCSRVSHIHRCAAQPWLRRQDYCVCSPLYVSLLRLTSSAVGLCVRPECIATCAGALPCARDTWRHDTSNNNTRNHNTRNRDTGDHNTCSHTTCSHTTCSHTTCSHTTVADRNVCAGIAAARSGGRRLAKTEKASRNQTHANSHDTGSRRGAIADYFRITACIAAYVRDGGAETETNKSGCR